VINARKTIARAVFDALESRQLMSTDPSVVLASADYSAARTELQAGLTASMQTDLTNHIGRQSTSLSSSQRFDKALLELMRSAPGAVDSTYSAVIRNSGTATGLDGNFFYSGKKFSSRTDNVVTRAQAIRDYDGAANLKMNVRSHPTDPTKTDVAVANSQSAVPIDYNHLGRTVSYTGTAPAGDAQPADGASGYDAVGTDVTGSKRFNAWRDWAQAFQLMQTSGTDGPAVAESANATPTTDYTVNPGTFVKRISSQLADWSSGVKPIARTTTTSIKDDLKYYSNKQLAGDASTTMRLYDKFDGNRLDFVSRAETFAWVYPMIVDSQNWSAADNTLLMYQMMISGRYLKAQSGAYNGSFSDNQTPSDPDVGFQRRDYNKILSQAKSLVYGGIVFKEFADSASWVTSGHDTLFNRGDGYSIIGDTLYDDGGHREQSGTYWRNSLQDLVETYTLDARTENGFASLWTTADLPGTVSALTLTERSHDLYYDTLQPNNETHIIGEAKHGSSMEPAIVNDALLNKNLVPNLYFQSARNGWLKDPSTYPLVARTTAEKNNWLPTGRSYTNSVWDSGNFVLRSNDQDFNDRSILFRGGDIDPTPDRQPTSLGWGPHSRQDLLSIDLYGNGGSLLSPYDDTRSSKKAAAFSRNLMSVNSAASSIPRDNWQMRTYDVATPAATITAHGQWDNSSVGVGGRDYLQATSWHDAWRVNNGKTPPSQSDADVARTIWMLDGSNYSTASTRTEQRFGTTMVMDFGKSASSQNYDVNYFTEGTAWQATSGQYAAGFKSTTASGSNTTVTTIQRVALPSQIDYINTYTTNVEDTEQHLQFHQTANRAVFASLITTSLNSTPTPAFAAKWQRYDTAGTDFRAVVMKNPSNPTSTSTFADEMWGVNFDSDGAIATRDAVASPINAATFDKAAGVAASGTATATSSTSATSWNKITDFNTGDYLRFERIQFGSAGAGALKLRMATYTTTNKVEVRLDSSTSAAIATLTVGNNGGVSNDYTFTFANGQTVTGTHDIYISAVDLAASLPASIESFQLFAPGNFLRTSNGSPLTTAAESPSQTTGREKTESWLASEDQVL
jgi:hypothetical protein